MDLFANQHREHREKVQPLPVRMRPRSLDDIVGQDHFLGEGKLLRRLLDADRLTSAIFYGPPGCGKTTLAHVVAKHTSAEFRSLNAAACGVKEVRQVLEFARGALETSGRRTVLFIDEIHRFNRAQQDVLLGDVEEGVIILLGATTENPFFSVNSPLMSRSQLFQFEPLDDAGIVELLRRALADKERGLGRYEVELTDDAAAFLATSSDGDARRALSSLEVAVLSQLGGGEQERSGPVVVDKAVAADSIQRKLIEFDPTGDSHYDSVSAMIKSIRGSDPDAAVYWLARLLEAGEDPRFVARRIVIAAAEDIGNADPQGLVIAQAAAEATHFIGMPECQLPLAQAAIYLACAPKSNASALAVWGASGDVRNNRTRPVPRSLRDGHYPGSEQLGAGQGYAYAHDHPEGLVEGQYLGVDKVYYRPTDRGYEQTMGAYLSKARRIHGAKQAENGPENEGNGPPADRDGAR